ncbi:hypothetical protein JCM10213_001552 [Rhodosporidiobolus nylandii]
MASFRGPVLVTGATGKQGSSVIRALQQLSSPPKIRALTRNINSPTAEKLKAQGVEVVKGDFADAASLQTALAGAASAFLVTIPDLLKPSLPEVEQGKAFIQAAKATSLPFLVFTSVSDATPTCGVPHFETKAVIEEGLKASGVSHTILAPVAFMDNFPKQSSFGSFAAMGLFDAALCGKKLQLIAVDDIGHFAAQALANPSAYAGRTIKLAGDDLSMEEVRQTYARVQRTAVWKAWLPGFLVALLPHDFKAMLRWFHDKGFTADVAALRKEHPGLRTFEQFLREGSKAE